MTTSLLLTVSLSLAASSAFAQPQAPTAVDPILAHFREFRAALDRGDAAAAERALDASTAVNGPKTAALALNLATLRLDLGKPTAAYAPAKRAYELATADATAGVDPLMAALALGRAQLAVEGANGATLLGETIAQAERRGDLHSEAYSAAVDLARTSFTLGQYETARSAWATSARLAAGSPNDPAVARGLAHTGEGAAIFMQAVKQGERRPNRAGVPITVIDASAVRDANAAFTEALDLLQPAVDEEADGGDESALTLAPGAYAQALAWQGALRAKLQSQGDDLPRAEYRGRTAPGATARCAVRLVAEPAPTYPSDALLASGFGAVVMRIRTDAQGAVVERQIAAAIPQGSFSEAVAAVADEWRVEVAADLAPGCRLDGTRYTSILFVAE